MNKKKKMNKNISFHRGSEQPSIEFTTSKVAVKKKRKWTANRKKINRKKYKVKVKKKKQEKIRALVDKIKDNNVVVNLSNVDIPDAAYLFLSKGLGYIPSTKVDPHDLKYDTTEFIRKLEWKAFFKANPELQSDNHLSGNEYADIKVSSFSHPNFTNPLLEDVKTKLFGWISNHIAKAPKSNLTPLELRGRKWLIDQLQNETLFITKADKGGATLIMNYTDVKSSIENELFDERKFQKLEKSTEEQLSYVKDEVKSLVIHLAEKKMITENDKTLIAGINANNRPKLAPEYRPEPPYAYPLFKLHKLSKEDITNKRVPPSRLVHASRYSPLYRMEKWTSPHLTKISREFCKEEFILDTGDLIESMKQLNQSGAPENENVNLFTLDVEKLYPSIQPDVALQAIRETFSADTTTDRKTKAVLETFVKMSFEHSYISYKNECYKSKVGIPTGGSLSRQIADIVLHWIMFRKMTPKLSEIQAIRLWKRFIDDCLGIWRGSRRSFDIFVKQLNAHTMKYGIKFPLNEIQFGKSVHVLDLCTYLDENNVIHHCGYTKPTDSQRYLNPSSFHPQSVFNSIPFSQMLRVIRNNSKEETRNMELDQCVQTFTNSGYDASQLIKLKEKALNKTYNSNPQDNDNDADTLVFPVHYFDGIAEFKSVVQSLKNALASYLHTFLLSYF